MRWLSYALLILLTSLSASAQTLTVSHLDAEFAWDVPAHTPEQAPTSHVLTCGTTVVTIPMPGTSIPVRDVVAGPGTYTCTLYAQNAIGRQNEPNVPFPLFQSGYTPHAPQQAHVLEEPGEPQEPPAMPVAWGSIGTDTTFDNRSNTSLSPPASISDGDTIMLVLAISENSLPSVTLPSGFTNISNSPNAIFDGIWFHGELYVAWKTAASESGNYTFTHGTAWTRGVAFRITGADMTGAVVSPNEGTGSTTTFLSVDTPADNSLVLAIGHDWFDTSNDLTAPTGTTPTFTERYDPPGLLYMATGTLATAGATGNKTMTNNSGNSPANPWAGFLVAIPPAAAASSMVQRPNPMAALIVR